MLTHSAGFKHSYLPIAERRIGALGRESGRFEAVTGDDCQMISAESLRDCDVLIFATTGELPMSEAQKRAILEFVGGGKGFFGIHNAADTFYQWPEYGRMLGGYFSAHPWTQEAIVRVEDRNHPATRMLPARLRVFDEFYTYRDWDRNKTHVLMSLDNSSIDLSKGNRADHDYALAWCHSYGRGRVIYSGLGHPDELWDQDWFGQHILGCILWAAGQAS